MARFGRRPNQPREPVPEVDVRTTEGFKLTLVWIAGCFAAVVVGLAPISAAMSNGHYIPVGADAFYHARRILDTVADPSRFFQFDPAMHVPEGSLVTWPWAYDWTMSRIVRLALALHLGTEPLAILDKLPVLGFVIAQTLMLVICRQLRLGVAATLITLLATAFFPLNQIQYGIGNFHHHFAEHLFVLGALASGLGWLRQPDSLARAALTGVVLGISVGVHTAQFIVQIPLVCALAWMWLKSMPLPRHVPVFAGTLALATFAVALPSLALREGHFDVYTLSWFQVYFASCTAVFCVLLARLRRSPRNIGMLIITAILVALPALGEIVFAERFITNGVNGMDTIGEVRSPWHVGLQPAGISQLIGYYTPLIFLLPLTLGYSAWRLAPEIEGPRIFFWIACVLGLVLVTQQLRMNYFGSFALYLPWIVAADERARRAARPAYLLAALGAIGVLFYAPTMAFTLAARRPLANDIYYQMTQPIYSTLADACQRDPGAVLAQPFDGHYIRFRTDCSVIANNFLVTPQHERKYLEVSRLLSMPAAQVLGAAPYVKYVFVQRYNLSRVLPSGAVQFTPRGNLEDPDLPLVHELLTAKADQLPAHYRLLKELAFPGNADAPYARLFELDRN
jgi:hypothetical protein